MASRKRGFLLIILVVVVAAIVFEATRGPGDLVLTGVVTSADVVVSPQMSGDIDSLFVKEGDTVSKGARIATLSAGEAAADQAFYANSEQGSAAQVTQSEAALKFEQTQAVDQVTQAQAALGALTAQRVEAAANLATVTQTLTRDEAMLKTGGMSQEQADQARNGRDVAKARLDALDKQIEAGRAAVSLAQANEQQVIMRQSALTSAQRQYSAAQAQTAKASVRLGYRELRSPVSGIVDVEPVRAGEFVSAGQPVLTLIDPDDLWVRADVEETYVDRIKIGDSLNVKLPWGEIRKGAVFYRAADAGFATQRDVSRSKRDITTFEIRLRVNNKDRKLGVGMTAYVMLPVKK